jgi:hypothetical protein
MRFGQLCPTSFDWPLNLPANVSVERAWLLISVAFAVAFQQLAFFVNRLPLNAV